MQYRERVIFIGQHIDEEFSNQVLATMLYLDSMDDSKKLHLYINGPGGDVKLFILVSLSKICPSFCFLAIFIAKNAYSMTTYNMAMNAV